MTPKVAATNVRVTRWLHLYQTRLAMIGVASLGKFPSAEEIARDGHLPPTMAVVVHLEQMPPESGAKAGSNRAAGTDLWPTKVALESWAVATAGNSGFDKIWEDHIHLFSTIPGERIHTFTFIYCEGGFNWLPTAVTREEYLDFPDVKTDFHRFDWIRWLNDGILRDKDGSPALTVREMGLFACP